MFEWFESLSEAAKIYAYIAIPSSVILLIQTVMVFIGFGDTDGDMDTDGIPDGDAGGDDGFALFSVRGIMAFLCVGGWSGMAFAQSGIHIALVIAFSFILGFGALVGIAFLMRGFMKLQDQGNTDIANAVGKIGEVYIPIPSKGRGKGKITLVLQNKFSELSAISNDEEDIKTGESVRVVSTNGMDLVLVERLGKKE